MSTFAIPTQHCNGNASQGNHPPKFSAALLRYTDKQTCISLRYSM